MRAVNLLPRDDKRREWRQPSLPALVGVVGVVLLSGVLASWFLLASANVTDKNAELEAARAELAAVPPPAPPDPGEVGLEQEKDQRISVLSSALASRVAWDRILRELSLVVPDDVWLGNLTASTAAAAAGAAPAAGSSAQGGFNLTGYTYSHDGVARLLARLALVPHLKDLKLKSSAIESLGSRPVVRFNISAVVREPGAA